jgi:hypothetical protein
MSSNKKYQYTDSAGFVHYMPENTAIPIEEAARIYNVTQHETGKTYTVKEEPAKKPIAESTSKPEPIKYKQPIDYAKEIERLHKETFPEPPKKVGTIREFAELLNPNDY